MGRGERRDREGGRLIKCSGFTTPSIVRVRVGGGGGAGRG